MVINRAPLRRAGPSEAPLMCWATFILLILPILSTFVSGLLYNLLVRPGGHREYCIRFDGILPIVAPAD